MIVDDNLCPNCYTTISHELIWEEWSDVPQGVRYTCSYGCTYWEESLDEETYQRFIDEDEQDQSE